MATPQEYYTNWQDKGLQTPERPQELRDWLQSVGLNADEDYLIDSRVEKISMGLGWDQGVDVDASAGLFDAGLGLVDLVWWYQLKSKCKSVKHSGDDRTGEGGGDDEVITVDVPAIPLRVHHILFAVCIYSDGYSFHQVRKAYVRMMNGKPKHNKHVLCEFQLTEMTGHAMLMGLMTRKGAYWNFRALGLPAVGRTMHDIVQFPQNLECLSMSPSHPPLLRRVKVRVIKGENLVATDTGGLFRRTATSDPYFTIKFRKQYFKSPHISKTLNPTWKVPDFELGLLIESEPKALKIMMFDYDAVSKDDFMGSVWIPASALYNAGPGSHDLWFNLGPSKEPEFRNCKVSGRILLTVTVADT